MLGTIDKFNAAYIEGSIIDARTVELYVDGELADTQEAFPLGDTFRFRFANPVGAVTGMEALDVRFQGLWEPPQISANVVGYLPQRVDLTTILRNYYQAIPDYPHVPQHLLDYIGSGEAGQVGYRSIGFIYFYYCLVLLGLPANSRVLDIGSGAGRIGFAMAPYLGSGGGCYLGCDTWEEGIEWAHANISKVFPFLSFHKLPSPPQGHRKGYLADYATSIPSDSESSDLVLCTSLFTHLKRSAYVAYLGEILRCLKPNALALITTFLVDKEEYKWLKDNKTNESDDYGTYTIDHTYADSYLLESKFFEDIREVGLTVCRYLPGSWRQSIAIPPRKHFENFQDILILKKT